MLLRLRTARFFNFVGPMMPHKKSVDVFVVVDTLLTNRSVLCTSATWPWTVVCSRVAAATMEQGVTHPLARRKTRRRAGRASRLVAG